MYESHTHMSTIAQSVIQLLLKFDQQHFSLKNGMNSSIKNGLSFIQTFFLCTAREWGYLTIQARVQSPNEIKGTSRAASKLRKIQF